MIKTTSKSLSKIKYTAQSKYQDFELDNTISDDSLILDISNVTKISRYLILIQWFVTS